MSDEEFVKQRCADCDIIFGISKSAEEPHVLLRLLWSLKSGSPQMRRR